MIFPLDSADSSKRDTEQVEAIEYVGSPAAAPDGSPDGSMSIATAPKVRNRRPVLHNYKDTKAYTLVQQHEMLHEIVYSEILYEYKVRGVSHEIALDPAALMAGSVGFFWLEICKIIDESPAFKSKNQVVVHTTARTYFESVVESKKSRMLKGETHEDAFLKTGEGSDDDGTGNSDLRLQMETRQQLCYQIEEVLAAHVQKILDRELEVSSQQKDSVESRATRISAGFVQPGAKQQGLTGATALVSTTKRKLMPPAPESDLVDASMNGKKKTSTSAQSFKNVRQKQCPVDKYLDYQSGSAELSQSMLLMCKQPSIEEKIAMTNAKVNAYASALGNLVVEGICEWKKKPEVLKLQNDFLKITSAELYEKIRAIGSIFANNPALKSAIESNGLDGMILGFMSDDDLKEFFVKECQLQSINASMLVAKIKAWKN